MRVTSDICQRNLDRLVDRAEQRNDFVRIDIESSPYIDPTIQLFRTSRDRSQRVGIQA